jgi:hypothetical protein
MSYITSFNQNVVADANNSSNAPLNAGLVFAGLATSTLGVAGIQVSLKTDQNSTIYIDQSGGLLAGVGTATITGTNTLNGVLTKFTRDLNIGDVIIFDPAGTPQTLTITSITTDVLAGVSTAVNVGVAKSFNQYYWDIQDTYSYNALVNNAGFTTQAVSSYLRVRVKNTSIVNQTYLRLQTALCPIVEAVPRSLSTEGNLKIGVAEDIAVTSTLNCTTNIAAGVTWSGTFDVITNQTAIQFILLYNQNTSIYVEQSLDGSTAALTDTFYGFANTAVAQSVASVASFFRIRVKNQNAGVQAIGGIVAVKTAILNVLPRILDNNGHLRISSPTDPYGFEIENTPTGEGRSITPIRIAGVAFEGSTVDPTFWTVTNANGGTTTQANGRLDLLTNTTANGSTTIVSYRRGRYIPASSMAFRSNMRVGDTGTVDNIRKWGVGLVANYTLTISSASVVAGDVYTDISGSIFQILITGTVTTATVLGSASPVAGARTYTRASGTGAASLTGSAFTVVATITDGYYFQLSGTTFSVVTSIGGTPTPVNSGSFNGVLGSTYTPSTNVTTYEVYWNTKNTWFVINGNILHTVSNALTPLSNSQSLSIVLSNVNSNSSISNVAIYARSLSIRRLGALVTQSTSIFQSGTTAGVTLKYGLGVLKSIIISSIVTGSVVTLYDSITAAGKVLWSATLSVPTQANSLLNVPYSLDFKDMPFFNGLTLYIGTQNCNILTIFE